MRFAWILLFAACSAPEADAPPEAPEGTAARVIDEGTREAIGVLAMLNDASTTVHVLDIDARLDVRAARNLVQHRKGPDNRSNTADDDLFDTIAEVDAVKQVGDATLQKLLDFAEAGEWIPSDTDYYGTVEGVSFTVGEATTVIAVANTSDFALLDIDIGLDSRAAQGIVDTRPFTSVAEIGAVPYVGPNALERLRTWAIDHPATDALTSAEAEAALAIAVDGLYFMSESDYPLTIVRVDDVASITAANAKEILESVYVAPPYSLPLADLTVEESSLAWMFDRTTVPQDWWDQDYYDAAADWQAVRDIFEDDLTGTVVFRIGEDHGGYLGGAITVFAVGFTSDGDLVGVRTVSVET